VISEDIHEKKRLLIEKKRQKPAFAGTKMRQKQKITCFQKKI
jgi:hypothetical protein